MTSTGQPPPGAAAGRRPGTAEYLELGRRLRAERERVGLSLRALAGRLELSPSALSQIETGRSRPSVSSLYAITSELGISLDSLFAVADPGEGDRIGPDQVDDRTPHSPVQRAGSRKMLEMQSGVRWERLTPSADSEVDFLFVTYEPGSSSSGSDALMRHSGREYGVVLEGELAVTVGFDDWTLAPGDAISFDSTTPHRLWNRGNEAVRAIWIVIGRTNDPRTADAIDRI